MAVNSNTLETLEITYGVPQGSVLGQLPFFIYFNDLPFSLLLMTPISTMSQSSDILET